MSTPATDQPDIPSRLAEDGVVVLHDVLDSAWIDRLRAATDEALATPTPLGHQFESAGGAFHSDMYLSASFPAFRSFSETSPVAALMGNAAQVSRVVLFTDELLVKEPGAVRETPWHHDLPYWPIRGEHVYSCWIPLDPVTEDTGALQFWRGSHAWGRRFHPRDFDTGAERVTGQGEASFVADAREPAEAERLVAECGPGDVVLFHGLTLHRASGNPSPVQRRRAVVLRLVGPDVTYDPRPRTLPLIWAPRLAPGEPLSGELFPTLWSRT